MRSRPLAKLLLAGALGSALCFAPQARAVDEGELKAAIVFNVLLFVEWPVESLPEPGRPLALCIGPGSPARPAMQALNSRPLHGSRLEVRDLLAGDGARACQAVFIDSADRVRLGVSLKAQRAGGALVLSDDPDAPRDATAIVLEQTGNRIAIDVNLQPLRQAKLQLSSKLLRLARMVRE